MSGSITHLEALQKGIINPAEFIPIAEETKIYQPLGEWGDW
jgi:EAL domain-containing protein (putative c-di-GMP-specific phosphodiesterase class I)